MYSSQFLDLAISTAAECLEDPRLTPFGAVVVRNGEVLSVGVSSVIRDNNPVAHAEVNAIQSACRVLDSYLLTDCDLYCSGFPCPLCLSAARWAEVKQVYYAASLEDSAEFVFLDQKFYYDLARQDWSAGSEFPVLAGSSTQRAQGREVISRWKNMPNVTVG